MALGLSAYLASGGRQFNRERGTGKVPLRRSGDHSASVDALLDALRSLGQDPSEEKPGDAPEPASGLRVVETAA